MAKIIMITGGQRSGKSVFAEKMALELSENPVYVASAMVFDDEFRHRVEVHQARRGPQWTNFEEPLYPSTLPLEGRTVLLDCLTLLATNTLFDKQEDASEALSQLKSEIDALKALKDTTIIIVTNEIGLGGVSENALQRKFTDLQGSINQYVAEIAEEVYFVISGIKLKIKG